MTDGLRVTSLDNPRVKEAVKLRERRARRKLGRFLVEGRREITRALVAGVRCENLFVSERAEETPVRSTASAAVAPTLAEIERLLERAGGRVLRVSDDVYRKLAVREGADGVLGVFATPDHSVERLRLPAEALVLAASGVEKPGNVGALLRTADAFGVDALLVEGGTDLFNPNVVRASVGCLFTVPVAEVPAGGLLSYLREQRFRIVAASPEGERTPDRIDFSGRVAILVGSEDQGLAPGAISAAEERVRIPMRGQADSLNVSVAAAVLVYEADRQRVR